MNLVFLANKQPKCNTGVTTMKPLWYRYQSRGEVGTMFLSLVLFSNKGANAGAQRGRHDQPEVDWSYV